MKDNINPSHYKNGKVEAIDAIKSLTRNDLGINCVQKANLIKYLWRYESKNGLEDVKKAKWYYNHEPTSTYNSPTDKEIIESATIGKSQEEKLLVTTIFNELLMSRGLGNRKIINECLDLLEKILKEKRNDNIRKNKQLEQSSI